MEKKQDHPVTEFLTDLKMLDPFETQFRLLQPLNKSHVTIFDIGANKGQTAQKYRALFADADMYCFEPFPDSIKELTKQFSEDQHIHIVPKAVAREKGAATFYLNEFDPTHSLLPRPYTERRYYPQFANPLGTMTVETVDIDGFISDHLLSTVDILKLDIQGGELDALHGAKTLLRAGKTSIIYTEIMFIPHYEKAPYFHEIWAFLANYGYSLFDIYDLYRATNGQLRYGDALFVSESVRKEVIDQFPEEP